MAGRSPRGGLAPRVLERGDVSLKQLVDEDLSVEFSDDEQQSAAAEAAAQEVDDAPVVKFIQKVMLDAIASTASATAWTATCARSRSRR